MDANLVPIVDARLSIGKKFDPDDMSPMFARLAYEYAENYEGSFDFMLDMKNQAVRGRSLSNRQVSAILNCAMAERRREIAAEEVQEELNYEPGEAASGPDAPPPAGIYTIDVDGHQVTIRLEAPQFGTFDEGTLLAKYLVMGAMEYRRRDWFGFGFVAKDRVVRIWKNQKEFSALPQAALAILLMSDDPSRYGFAYALMSGRCWVCGAELSDPVSVQSGIGPTCASKLGINRDGLSVEDAAKGKLVKELVVASRVG